MGTRLNYEIYTEHTPEAKPAMVLYSNSAGVDAEGIFRRTMNGEGYNSITEKVLFLLGLNEVDRFSGAKVPVFTLDSSQGDRESVIKAYRMDDGSVKVIKENNIDNDVLTKPMTPQQAAYKCKDNNILTGIIKMPVLEIIEGDFENFIDEVNLLLVEEGCLNGMDYDILNIDHDGNAIISVSGEYEHMGAEIIYDVEVSLFTPDDLTTASRQEVIQVIADDVDEAKSIAEDKFVNDYVTLEPGEIVEATDVEVAEPEISDNSDIEFGM